MKKDDEFALKNEEYDDNARAVNESELLPIFEAMNFSGDIQPLEDIEVPEPVTADFQRKKKTELKGSDKNRDLKKKKIPVISGLNKITQIIIAAAVALIIIGAASFGIYSAVNNGTNVLPVKTIYSSDRNTFVDIGNGKEYEISEAQDIRVSEDGKKVYYSRNTSSRTGKYDIKYVNAEKLGSLKKGGSNICTGVDEGWTVNADGSFMCYSVTKSREKKFYIFNAETGKSEEISSEIEEVFLPPAGDVVYFTRRNGSIYSLHRMRYGEKPENVASKISFVKFFSSDKNFEILYTVATGKEENVDVYSVKNFDKPVQICSDASEVYLNDYVCGGNLYYFKKSKSAVNWQDFVNDSYYEADMKLKSPVESDYMIEYGFIIKRYILDKTAYDAAKAKYNAKLQRDEIRDELDKIDFGLAAGSDYNCYVYNNTTNKMLATGVALKNILAFSETESPRIVFRKSVISVENKISMDELVKLSDNSGAASACDYARGNVEDSFEMSDECIYAVYDGSKVIQYGVGGYKSKNTRFMLDSKKMLYALEDSKLYCNEITGKGIGENHLISGSVSECEIKNGFAYYMKSTGTDFSTLCRYSAENGEQCIGENVYSYVSLGDDKIVIFSKQDDESEGVVIGLFDGKNYSEIDRDVSLDHFRYTDNSVSYIKNIGNSDVVNAGDMYIYTVGGKPKRIGSDVTDIEYISEGLTAEE